MKLLDAEGMDDDRCIRDFDDGSDEAKQLNVRHKLQQQTASCISLSRRIRVTTSYNHKRNQTE